MQNTPKRGKLIESDEIRISKIIFISAPKPEVSSFLGEKTLSRIISQLDEAPRR